MVTIPRSAILGVLLSGGRSRRMGVGDKCLIELGGRTLLDRAIERLAPQVARLIVNANGDPERFARFGAPIVSDSVGDYPGPLAGVLAGMLWAWEHAPEIRLVATVATDTPFFPLDLVARLSVAIGTERDIAIARCRGRDYPVFGLFPLALVDDLTDFLRQSRNLAVTTWIDRHRWTAVDFPLPRRAADPFLNVNTPEDLLGAQALLGSGTLHKP